MEHKIAQKILRDKWENLPQCPYGCGGKLFGNVCSRNCYPSRVNRNCSDEYAPPQVTEPSVGRPKRELARSA